MPTDPTPRPSAEGAAREPYDAVDAAREMCSALGLTPTLRQMRGFVAALKVAEERGAAREREECERIARAWHGEEAEWSLSHARVARVIAEEIRARSGGEG